MKRCCVAECQDRYIHVDFIAFMRSREISIDSNQLLEAFLQKASATVLARELYSYEVDVENLS